MNLYINDRLAWDLNADVDLLLEEFFTRFYGPAAEPMRAYWMGIERLYCLERPGTRPDRRIFAGPDAWTELDGHLQQAARLIADLPASEQRFADRVQFERDGLEWSRLMTYYQWEIERKSAAPATVAAFFTEHGARLDAIAKKYTPGNPYWPQIAPYWALAEYDISRLKERHQIR